MPEGAPEHSSHAASSCQCLAEVFFLPTTEGGVNYLYKVSHLSLSTNSAARDLAPYFPSSSVKLRELEYCGVWSCPLKSTGLHLLPCSQEAGHRGLSIPLLCLLQIYLMRESSCLWRLYNSHNQRNHKKPNRNKTPEVLPHYSTFLSNKIPNRACPNSVRTDGPGVREKRESVKKNYHMRLSNWGVRFLQAEKDFIPWINYSLQIIHSTPIKSPFAFSEKRETHNISEKTKRKY